MTTVWCIASDHGGILLVDGHADRLPGVDGNLICAAVSILTQSFAQFMLDRDEKVKDLSVRFADGEAKVTWNWDGEELAEVNGALELARTGFKLLEERYPGYVMIL